MIILDTSFVVAFHNARDVHHARAVEVMTRFLGGEWGRGLLLEYVFLEIVTVLAARRGQPTANRVGTLLLEARELDFVPCSSLFADTLSTFRDQGAGVLSFVDAAIVTLARSAAGSVVASFDTDFEGVEGVRLVPGVQ
ncbi:MAG TPA: PIN domain-containing protein [Thermoanaerobaculia bacterium]|nr:PIN domain-containing protein [Thermoanaerobaculia bacterium]